MDIYYARVPLVRDPIYTTDKKGLQQMLDAVDCDEQIQTINVIGDVKKSLQYDILMERFTKNLNGSKKAIEILEK